MSDFVHLHLHTTYSLLDGQCQIVPLVKRAREWGMRALSVTDHGNLFALKTFYDECRSTKEKTYGKLPVIKPILGCEAYVTSGDYRERDKNEQRFHLCLHAKNLVGYHNLVRLISEAHINGMYYKPRIDHALLEKYHEGLHCSSACLAGEVAKAITAGRMDEAERVAKWYKDLFGNDFSLEVMEHRSVVHPEMNRDLFEKQRIVTKGVFELAKKLDIRVIATNDVHFMDKDDNDSHDVLLCLSTGRKMSDPPRIGDEDNADGSVKRRLVYTGEEWFKPEEEMRKVFPENPEVLKNTLEVADMIEEYELDSPPIMPKFPIPQEFGNEESIKRKYDEPTLEGMYPPGRMKKLGGYEKVVRIQLEAEYLASLVWEGSKKRWGENLPKETVERVQFELETIRTMGFPGYFLIVRDYIRAAREECGVWVGPGRGSAAGSAVAYALWITNVDPLKYDLLFERFLNPDRISMPDIDVDFDDNGRAKVLEYVTNKYGKDHVAHIVTFGQMAAKSAIKDVGRVMDYPLPETNKLASYVPDTPKITFKKAMAESPDLKAAFESPDPVVHQIMERAGKLEGSIRQPGIHACGILISRDPLIDTLPVMPTPGESLLCTQYDGHFVEPVGLLKMDFLGLKTLSVEKECVSLLKEVRGIDLNPDDIPDDDEETYKLFGRGETTGLFQFESDGMKKYLMELQPERLTDLVAMNALYRPGPLAYIPTFIARKLGKEPIKYDHPLMEKYLKDTYGVTVYQEQVMLLSRLLGGFTRGESDKLRKAMGKKQLAVMEELKVKFVEGCLANENFRIGEWKDENKARTLIDKIWDDWKAFASYAFNKSHAVCYAWVAYQTGYMKAHYPAEFMCAQISSEIGNFDKLPGFVAEAEAIGLKVLRPDVNESLSRFAPVHEGKAIRYGMAGVKGVGQAAADCIVAERKKNGPYKGLMDFTSRLAEYAVVNKRVLENLIRCGAFDGFFTKENKLHRATFFNNVEFAIKRASSLAKSRASGQMDMFGMLTAEEDSSDTALKSYPALDAVQHYMAERELTGIYLTGHPLGVFKRALATLSTYEVTKPPEIPYMDEVHAERQIRVPVRLGGMLKACQVRMSKPKKEGDVPQPWAILLLDDGENQVEALAFARTYAKYKDWLNPEYQDKPILVCGNLSHKQDRNTQVEEEALQFIAQEIYPLEKGIRLFSKVLYVKLLFEDLSLLEKVKAVRAVAEAHPGQLKLRIDVITNAGFVAEIDSGVAGVDPSSEFFRALEECIPSSAYGIQSIKEVFLEPPERKPWERRQ